MRLRSGWISPAGTPRCRRAVPFDPHRPNVAGNGDPIATESALQSPSAHYSLGVFHRSPIQLLASFAVRFPGQSHSNLWPQTEMLVSPSPLTHARQATLHTAHDSAHRNAGSYLFRTRSSAAKRHATAVAQQQVSHGNRVGYSMPLECARDP